MSEKPVIIKKGVLKEDIWYGATCSECGMIFKYTETMTSLFYGCLDDDGNYGVKCPLEGCGHAYILPKTKKRKRIE